jgi:transposase
MKDSIAWVGLDVHSTTIDVSVAPLGAEPYRVGNIDARLNSVAKVIRRLEGKAQRLSFAYESGPFGYDLYRMITGRGHHCIVAATSKIPLEPGRRIKNDPRDSMNLAVLNRNGMLTPVWVPDRHQEAVRGLVRCRHALKKTQTQARQRLVSMLTYHGRHFTEGRSRWTQKYWRWLAQQEWDERELRQSFEHYLTAVRNADEELASVERHMEQAMEGWSLEPLATGFMAMRGIALVSGMSLAAELGDVQRFEKAPHVPSFVGLVPGEHSSGDRHKRGPITKQGNALVRDLAVEAAHAYQYNPGVGRALRKRQERVSEQVRRISWEAQKRLCARYDHLKGRGKSIPEVTTAIARELLCFCWAVGQEVHLDVPAQPAGWIGPGGLYQ